MFFEDWAERFCKPELYTLQKDGVDILRVDLDAEDAVMLKLKGIPSEFKQKITPLFIKSIQ